MIRRLLTAAILACLDFTAAPALADGLLYQLPEDGQWVRFHVELTANVEGSNQARSGTLTMASVGRADQGNQKCRWIELKADGFGEVREITKVLIPERYLTRGQDPLAHVLRAWRQAADAKPEKLEDFTDRGPLRVFLAGPLEDVKPLDKELVETKLGKFECEQLTARARMKEGPQELTLTYRVRLHDKAPFGVVSTQIDMVAKRNGQVEQTATLAFKLTDTGKDAKSDLPYF